MDDRTARRALWGGGAVLLALALALVWLAMVRGALGPAPEAAPPAAPPPEVARRPSRAPKPKAPAEPPVPVAVPAEGGPEAWFPGQSLFRCDAPDGLPDGRYLAPGAVVMVQGGAMQVASASAGAGLVRQLGTVVGHVAWQDGTCEASEPARFPVVGEVHGGGEHRVAGCPVGEVVRTDADGRFATTVIEGQPCTLRTVGEDGRLALGDRLVVDGTGPVQVVLEAAQPLPKRQVAMAETMLVRMAAHRLEEAQARQARWSAFPATDPWVAMMQADADREVAFFEGEQARLDDPRTRVEAVESFLLGLSD